MFVVDNSSQSKAQQHRWRNPSSMPIDTNGPRDQPFNPLPDTAPNMPLITFFERAARRYPDRLALADGAVVLDFDHARRAVDHIAAAVAASTPLGAAVGILLPNEVLLPLCMVAVIAAGRVAVPLDLNAPPQRCEAILRASHAALVLSAPMHAPGRVPDGMMMLDAALLAVSAGTAASYQAPADVHAPAMVIYTSGSTGEPKGIAISQAGLVQRVMLHANACHVGADDRILPLSTPTSIAGAREVLTGLMTGGSVHLVDPRREGVKGTLSLLHQIRPTIVYAVPTLIRALCQEPGAMEAFAAIKVMRVGGEPFTWTDHALLRRHLPATSGIIAAYSSTEAICSHWFVPPLIEQAGHQLPVGWVNPGIQYLLADEQGDPVPDGTAGVLVLRSRYLALGYWIAGECLPGPMQADPDDTLSRIFNTGDMASLRTDGTLQLHGRADDMVKIAGHRVEPLEVEHVMSCLPGVEAAAVLIRRTPDGRPHLIGFLVPHEGAGDGLITATHRRLTAKLPSAMCPVRIHLLTTIPRNLNSKTDRNALLEIDEATLNSVQAATADMQPNPQVAWAVAAAWQRSFGRRSFKANETFDAAGGDSLKMLRLVYDIEQRLGTFTFLPFDLFTTEMKPTDIVNAITALMGASAPAMTDLRQPVFLFPGLGGDEPLLALFRAELAADLKFVTIAYPDWREHLRAECTFEMLVEELTSQIAKELAPIRLVGYSFGGLVAAAVAARLQAQGRHVLFLGLIDTPALPGPDLPPGPKLRRELAGQGVMRQALLERRLQDIAGLLLAETLCRPALRPALKSLATMRGWSGLPFRLRFATEAWLQTFMRSYMLRRGCAAGVPHLDQDVPVVLFRATEQRSKTLADHGWSARCSNLRVIDVPGSHHGIFEAGNRQVLTKQFLEAVDR